MGVPRELRSERALLRVVVAPYGAVEFSAVRLVVLSVVIIAVIIVVAAVRVEVRVALGLEGREDGLRK